MRKSAVISAKVLCLGVLLFMAAGQACLAGLVEYTLDPSQSYLTISGKFGDAVFEPQGSAGSMTTAYSGTIRADLSGSSLTFAPGSTINADENPLAPFQLFGGPGVVDNYGIQILDGAVKGVFRDILMDITQGTVTNGVVPSAMKISVEHFAFNSALVVEADGSLDPTDNTTSLLAELTTVGLVETLKIPVLLVSPPGTQQITFEGQWVGTREVPEPATWLLMGLGMIGLVAVARRKYGR